MYVDAKVIELALEIRRGSRGCQEDEGGKRIPAGSTCAELLMIECTTHDTPDSLPLTLFCRGWVASYPLTLFCRGCGGFHAWLHT